MVPICGNKKKNFRAKQIRKKGIFLNSYDDSKDRLQETTLPYIVCRDGRSIEDYAKAKSMVNFQLSDIYLK